MSLSSFFHSFGHTVTSPKTAQEAAAAGAVLSAFNPGLGSLVEMIAGAAFAIETAAMTTPMSGSDKKTAVKAIVDVAAPVALNVLSTVSGKPVTDAASVAPTIDSLIELVVGLFNTLGVFSHKPAQIAATATPALVPAAA